MNKVLFFKWVLEVATQEYNGSIIKLLRAAEKEQLEIKT